MPVGFLDNFGSKVCVVLDFLKVFNDRLMSYLPHAETWSRGLTTSIITWSSFWLEYALRVLSFLWESHGGRASDKHITEECGALDNLEYDDVVLADQDFLVAESVGMCHATLAMPAFNKGKCQISSARIKKTGEIANVCQLKHYESVHMKSAKFTRFLVSTVPSRICYSFVLFE